MTLSTTTKGEDLMTIAQAIQQAKENYDWQPVPGEPASVQVRFINRDGQDDETGCAQGTGHEIHRGPRRPLWKGVLWCAPVCQIDDTRSTVEPGRGGQRAFRASVIRVSAASTLSNEVP